MHENASLDLLVGTVDDSGAGPFLVSTSPPGRFQVAFEDNGDTGYFYALDPSLGDQPIIDAGHIYDVAQVTDRHRPSRASISWSTDGLVAVLALNGYAHAVFDFERGRGWCRSGFPPPSPRSAWVQGSHAWDSEAEALLIR